MVFCECASVSKFSIPLGKLIKKQWRVGLDQPCVWFEEGEKRNDFLLVLKRLLERLLFLSIIKPKKEVRPLKRMLETKEMKKYGFRLLLIGFFINITMNIANFIGMFKLKSVSKEKKI